MTLPADMDCVSFRQFAGSGHPVAANRHSYRVEHLGPPTVNARRFAPGNRIQLVLTSDDQNPDTPAILNFRHASVGTSSLNTIR